MAENEDKIHELELSVQEAKARSSAAQKEIELRKLELQVEEAKQRSFEQSQQQQQSNLPQTEQNNPSAEFIAQPPTAYTHQGSPLVPPEFAAKLRNAARQEAATDWMCVSPVGFILTVLSSGLYPPVFWLCAACRSKLKEEKPGPDAEPTPWDVLCEELHPPGLPGWLEINGIRIDPDPTFYTGPVYLGRIPYTGPGKKGIFITPEDLEKYWSKPLSSSNSGPSGTIEAYNTPVRVKRFCGLKF